jgi:predicted negative regulator of RcsB-dependent stress response
MARHTTVRPRAAATEEDSFVAGVLEATAWSRRHSRLLIGLLIGLVVGVAGILYYRNYTTALESRAASELTQIRQVAAAGNLPLAKQQLTQFVTRFGGTRAADEARVLLAQTLLDQGDAKGAIPVVRPLAAQLSKPMGPPAAFLLGAAYEGTKQIAQAEATYLRIADDAAFDYQKRDALEDAARLKLQNNDPAAAAGLYRRILATMPDTAVGRGVYEMRLAQAEAETQGSGK